MGALHLSLLLLSLLLLSLVATGAADSVSLPSVHRVSNEINTTFYVSVDGVDRNGTNHGRNKSDAFKTLEHAQQIARAVLPTTARITIRIGDGDFYLANGGEPLVLTAHDSTVAWVGAGADRTTIRGGARVVDWAPAPGRDGVFRAKSPLPNASQPFFQLMEDRVPATIARFPNRGGGWLYNWTATGGSSFRWSNRTGLPVTFETSHAKGYTWHPYGYSEVTSLVDVNFVNRTASLEPAPHMPLVKMFLQGSVDFIDEPGEWAIGDDSMIYLMPSRGVDLAKDIVTAVLHPRLVDIRGMSSEGTGLAYDITIANMSLIGSGWLRNFESCWASRINSQPGEDPSGAWANTREGMIRVENASGVSITGCALLGAGSTAVWVEHCSQGVVVESNWIENVGAWGVMLNGWDVWTETHSIPGSHSFETAAAANVNHDHVIRNNFIHNVGRQVTYGAAVYVHQAHSVVVEHNVFARSPRNLISVFGVEWLYNPGIGPYTTQVYPDTPPSAYHENLSFFSQYDINTASNLTFARNDISHGCLDSQDCGVWEAWGPGRDNAIIENSFHDTWGGMSTGLSIIFPDSGNNFFTVTGNVIHNNVASGVNGESPGGASGEGIIQLKGYRQTFTDNIIADSSLSGGIWIGESGGFSLGEARVLRNIVVNQSKSVKGPWCGSGETSQSEGSLCYRNYDVVAVATVGDRLNASTGNASKTNPGWWNFTAVEKAMPAVVTVDRNVYSAPLEPVNSTLRSLRPDIDANSVGGATEASIGFARTAHSTWWNRTHLDYALLPSSVARSPAINIAAPNVGEIGIRFASWPFRAVDMFARNGWRKIEVESADRAFELYREPSFGISFPIAAKEKLEPLHPANVAIFNRVDFGTQIAAGAATTLTLRVCTPLASTGVAAAMSAMLREGSPDGPIVATVPLPPVLAAANCGYAPGSYWAPGFANDDPAAMAIVTVKTTAAFVATGRKNLFLSLNGGGYAAIDWLLFE